MNYSPLRYPGGKSKIAPLIRTIMQTSNNTHTTYIEPFAGGSGVALNLLLEGYVNHIVINDYDKAIYSFWRALKDDPWGFLEEQKAIHDRVVAASREIYEINDALSGRPAKRIANLLQRQKETLISEIQGLIDRVYRLDY